MLGRLHADLRHGAQQVAEGGLAQEREGKHGMEATLQPRLNQLNMNHQVAEARDGCLGEGVVQLAVEVGASVEEAGGRGGQLEAGQHQHTRVREVGQLRGAGSFGPAQPRAQPHHPGGDVTAQGPHLPTLASYRSY